MSLKTALTILLIFTIVIGAIGLFMYLWTELKKTRSDKVELRLDLSELEEFRVAEEQKKEEEQEMRTEEKKAMIINRLDALRATKQQSTSTNDVDKTKEDVDKIEEEKKQEIMSKLNQLKESSDEEVKDIEISDEKAEEERRKQEILDRLNKLRESKE